MAAEPFSTGADQSGTSGVSGYAAGTGPASSSAGATNPAWGRSSRDLALGLRPGRRATGSAFGRDRRRRHQGRRRCRPARDRGPCVRAPRRSKEQRRAGPRHPPRPAADGRTDGRGAIWSALNGPSIPFARLRQFPTASVCRRPALRAPSRGGADVVPARDAKARPFALAPPQPPHHFRPGQHRRDQRGKPVGHGDHPPAAERVAHGVAPDVIVVHEEPEPVGDRHRPSREMEAGPRRSRHPRERARRRRRPLKPRPLSVNAPRHLAPAAVRVDDVRAGNAIVPAPPDALPAEGVLGHVAPHPERPHRREQREGKDAKEVEQPSGQGAFILPVRTCSDASRSAIGPLLDLRLTSYLASSFSACDASRAARARDERFIAALGMTRLMSHLARRTRRGS